MDYVKKIFNFYVKTSLILKILIGMAVGVLLGLLFKDASFIAIFGDVFVGALKAIAPILVFVLVLSSVSTAGKNIGKRFARIITFYMATTFLASVIAVIASFTFKIKLTTLKPPSDEVPPEGLGQVLSGFFLKMVENPVSALINGNYIGILSWAVVFGFALRIVGSDNTKEVFANLSDAVSKVVGWVIQLAPFGIMGLVFSAVAKSGLTIFVDYGKLLAVLVGCMLFVSLVINPFIVFLCLKKNPYPLVFRCLKDSGISAFFTRSSAANIPVNMQLCKKLGLDEEYYSVAIPLGATINMDGAAITINILSLCAAFTCGIEVNFFMAILLCFVATLGACGASGVGSGSLLLIPMACSLLNVPAEVAMQMVAVGIAISVIQDSLETALNSSGDVIFAATAEYIDWQKKGLHFEVGKDRVLEDVAQEEPASENEVVAQ